MCFRIEVGSLVSIRMLSYTGSNCRLHSRPASCTGCFLRPSWPLLAWRRSRRRSLTQRQRQYRNARPGRSLPGEIHRGWCFAPVGARRLAGPCRATRGARRRPDSRLPRRAGQVQQCRARRRNAARHRLRSGSGNERCGCLDRRGEARHRASLLEDRPDVLVVTARVRTLIDPSYLLKWCMARYGFSAHLVSTASVLRQGVRIPRP